ncbi:hypothetical protein [Streptomyces sp. NPDC006510]|uniref:hypothetical protein n=1 Tax=Streptomyces sp. NPDC006510 TaxID=3155600 RepID=UPI0033BF0A99
MLDGRSASPPVKARGFTATAAFIAAPDLDCPLGSRITLPDGTWLVLAVGQQTPAPDRHGRLGLARATAPRSG